MADGPNFEKVFQGMSVFNGNDPNDVRVIKQYLRFYQDTDSFALYAKHYLPMLSVNDRAEFEKVAPAEPVDVPVVEEPVETEKELTETVVLSVPTPKKRGRPSAK